MKRLGKGALAVMALLVFMTTIILRTITVTSDCSAQTPIYPPQADMLSCSVGDNQDLTAPLLGNNIPLSLDTQKTVWILCEYDSRLFCTIMAIAKRESLFKLDAKGDKGRSIGMMQINVKWQRDRIERLGITDLTDPIQNVTVGMDYINYLCTMISPEDPKAAYGTHKLFMAYNSGYWGAKNQWKVGTTTSNYSETCVNYFHEFMNLLEVSA